MKREFVQLAHTYKPEKHSIGGWYASEKLDGMRAYWDGGWTRGMPTKDVPFANTTKDHIRIKEPTSTGLWSRYAKPIYAPSWWLDELPSFPLDGELFLGRGRFQELISIVKRLEPCDADWVNVEYRVFDIPSNYMFLSPGKINNPQWAKELHDFRDVAPKDYPEPMAFHKVLKMLELGKLKLGTGPAVLETQVRLSMQTEKALQEINSLLDSILIAGGEGLVLRRAESVWTPKRSWDLLKIKPFLDSEATVEGYIWGKGKYDGLMGAMIVEWQGKEFELSGFTDAERELTNFVPQHVNPDENLGYQSIPGKKVSGYWCNLHFPRGSIVTFKYRELTDAGIPKEARYWRKK